MRNRNKSILILCLVCLAVLVTALHASAASASLWFTDPGVIVGNNVSVVVDVKGDGIGGYQMNVSYDTAYLEFVSATGATNWFSGKDNGGVIAISDMNDSGTSTKMSFTLTFKTKKTGTTKLTPSEYRFFDGGGDPIAPGPIGDSTINIVPVPQASSDSSLKSLTVGSGTLSPAFSPATLEYAVEVDYSVTALTVSAIKNHNGASVYLENNELAVGENTVTITVTAENGAKTVYTIRVTRGRNPLGSNVFVAIGEAAGEISNTIDEAKKPKGFEATRLFVNSIEVAAMQYDEKGLPAVYILGGEGVAEGFYFVDVEKMTAYPFVYIGDPTKPLLLLDMNLAVAPEGYVLGKYTVDSVERDALIPKNSKEPNHCLIYAIGQFGEKTLYIYDPAENTYQRYSFADMGEPETTVPDTTVREEEDTKKTPETTNNIPNDDDGVKNKKPKDIGDVFKWIFLGIAVLVVILTVVAIILKSRYY